MKNKTQTASLIIIAAVCIISLGTSAALAVNNSNLKASLEQSENQLDQAEYAASEAEKKASAYASEIESAKAEIAELTAEAETTPQSESTVPADIIRDENTVYIYDNGIDTVEYPEIEGAVYNDYNMALLETDEKKRKVLYDENGEKRSSFGIDVSSYQGEIDWNAAAADGVEFAIIRIGYRGYETGVLVEDKYFRKNIEGAAAAGIETGVYFYSQALNEEEAAAEAEYTLNILSECNAEITLPVVFDWEFVTDEDPARTDDMTGEMQTLCCAAFCNKIREAGYDAMYYSTVNTAIFRYDMPSLSDYGLWVAEYSAKTDFVYDYAMWQYSCSGVVDGIDALTDLNILIRK